MRKSSTEFLNLDRTGMNNYLKERLGNLSNIGSTKDLKELLYNSVKDLFKDHKLCFRYNPILISDYISYELGRPFELPLGITKGNIDFTIDIIIEGLYNIKEVKLKRTSIRWKDIDETVDLKENVDIPGFDFSFDISKKGELGRILEMTKKIYNAFSPQMKILSEYIEKDKMEPLLSRTATIDSYYLTSFLTLMIKYPKKYEMVSKIITADYLSESFYKINVDIEQPRYLLGNEKLDTIVRKVPIDEVELLEELDRLVVNNELIDLRNYSMGSIEGTIVEERARYKERLVGIILHTCKFNIIELDKILEDVYVNRIYPDGKITIAGIDCDIRDLSIQLIEIIMDTLLENSIEKR